MLRPASAIAIFAGVMPRRSHIHAHLPSTLGFSPVDDRTRLPGRFFYRLIVGHKLA